MSVSVKFNGIELNNYIDVVQGFTPFTGANWDPEINEISGIPRGGNFMYTKYKGKTMPMPFWMRYGLEKK